MAKRTGTRAMPKGVRIRNGAVQIYFNHAKQAYHITLPHPPTTEGIKAAVKIRSELVAKAKWGVLTEDDIAKAKGVENPQLIDGILFQDVAQKFLKHCEANLDTRRGYARILQRHWMPDLALVPIHHITSDVIKDIIITKEFKTNKTLNNCLTPLRGVFQVAFDSKIIIDNPLNYIKNKKIQMDMPDPFTRERR